MPTSTSKTDPFDYLPLKPAVLAILVAVSDAPRHGYAIIQAVREPPHGIHLDTGPLYRFLKRLLDDGLVKEVDQGDDEERRRYYTLTTLGARVLDAERARLLSLLSRASTRASAR
jgi:DNA-binding PadR family transcriptional regulator